VRAEFVWRQMAKDAKGRVAMGACWAALHADDELGFVLGRGSTALGKAMLRAMEADNALDISGDGQIVESEFRRLFNPWVILAAEVKVRADLMWATAVKDAEGTMERLKCWEMIMADDELSYILGDGIPIKGAAILQAMKAVKALDISGDGEISHAEFKRLYRPSVIVAAQVKVRCDAMWSICEKDVKGQVERQRCWRMLLADEELGFILGKGNVAHGKEILNGMKAERALDVSGDGQISASEFARLFSPLVLVAAELKVRADTLWASSAMPKDSTGKIDRLKCWNVLMADDELSYIMGRCDVGKGEAILSAMKAARALDLSGDGIITQHEFKRLYNPTVIVSAEIKVRADAIWAAVEESGCGEVDRDALWHMLLKDDELGYILGGGDTVKGKKLLGALHDLRGLDENFDGLFSPAVLVAAGVKVRADLMWAIAAKDAEGTMERLKCWEMILTDDELSYILGRSVALKGKE